MGGPIFKDTDLVYRGIAIPRSFWKVIYFVAAGALKARALVLTQDDLEAKLESLGLDEFQLYGVSLAELAHRTGLQFQPADVDAGVAPEALQPEVRRIDRRDDIYGAGFR